MVDTGIIHQIEALKLWNSTPDIAPLTGGITNINFLVTDKSGKYVVRVGEDIPEHHIMRFNEIAASRAAFEAGISPEVIHSGEGLMVLRYIDSKTFKPEDVRNTDNLEKIIKLLRKCHTTVPNHLRGPAMIFWVFHVIRDYGSLLLQHNSVHRELVPRLVATANQLEQAAGPFEIVFSHNDLLAANILDDGKRLWLIDWDYAGFNSPLFDLGGLASNNELGSEQELFMLESYFGSTPDSALLKRYNAMKCASLLRESMWSMVSEIKSNLDFDYSQYTSQNLERFEQAHARFLTGEGI